MLSSKSYQRLFIIGLWLCCTQVYAASLPSPNEPAAAIPGSSPSPTATDNPAMDVLDLSNIGTDEEEAAKTDSGEHNAGDGGDLDDITATIRIEEIVEPSNEFRYAAFGKSNPFQAPDLTQVVEQKKAQNKSLEIPIVSPLQEYSITDLVTKGIWQLATKEWRAIIMTPKNEGIIIKVGDPISAGKVMAIDRNKVVARQYQVRADGTREFSDTNLHLNPDKKSGKIVLEPGKAPQFPGAVSGNKSSPTTFMPSVTPNK